MCTAGGIELMVAPLALVLVVDVGCKAVRMTSLSAVDMLLFIIISAYRSCSFCWAD